MIAGHLLFSQLNLRPLPLGIAISYRFIKYLTASAAASWTATITLASPDSRNLIDAELAEEFRDACQEIDADETARLLVVTGSGDCFSVGRQAPGSDASKDGTAESTGENSPERRTAQLIVQLERLRVADCLADLSIPVIVALNGDAIGHGLELALAGDLRIASAHARFGLAEPNRLSFPWDGGTQRLPRLVGPAWALDLALTSRLVDAEEALRLGLVNRVVAPEQLPGEVKRLAASILAGGPVAAKYAKEAVGKGIDLSLAQGLRLEADLSVILQSTADRAEGIASFKERRSAKFSGS